jgi:peptide/nickel transport system permease protein/oligopeptide transport system permease protein
MTRYILQRLAWSGPVLLGVSLIVFLILALAPGDAARALAGTDASESDIEALRTSLGLDRPLPMQYLHFLGRLVRLDLGRSAVTSRPVTSEIADNVRPTFELAMAAMVLAVVLGMALGVLSAIYRGTLLDNLFMLLALFGVSMPIFWLGLMLMLLFAVELRWLPTTGIGGPEFLVLPAVTLCGGSLAIIARMTRSSMLEVFGEDYVRTARAKGLQERTVVLGHVLRNALIPTVTAISLQLGYLLAGTVLTETVFARPGLGRMLVDAINLRDVSLAQGGIMLLATSFVLINLVVDVLYVYLDPRIRYD